jgi:predicted negative regulator of RcsB-dependent stress response
MAKKKMTRKELLKKPDEFLTFSGKAADFFNTHQTLLKYIGVAVAIVIVVYIAFYAYLGSVNRKGQEAYNKAYYTLGQNMKPDASPESLRKSEELFEGVEKKYGLSKASRLAIPQVGFLEFMDKRYDEAIVQYRKFLSTVADEAEYSSLTSLALAACLEAKGELKTAIETLKPTANAPGNPFKETAMLSLARIYRLDNRTDKSKEILKEFVGEFKDSPFLSMAKSYL